MDLFDIIKSFTSQKAWENVSKADKQRNLFMINRIMSIQFPLQANAFNNTKIDPNPLSISGEHSLLQNTKHLQPLSIHQLIRRKKRLRKRWMNWFHCLLKRSTRSQTEK